MFNLSGSELIFLVLIALVVLGPDKLPEAMRKAGKAYADFKKMTSGFQSEMKSVLEEPMRELRETADLVKQSAMINPDDLMKPLSGLMSDFTNLATGKTPASETAPSAAVAQTADGQPEVAAVVTQASTVDPEQLVQDATAAAATAAQAAHEPPLAPSESPPIHTVFVEQAEAAAAEQRTAAERSAAERTLNNLEIKQAAVAGAAMSFPAEVTDDVPEAASLVELTGASVADSGEPEVPA